MLFGFVVRLTGSEIGDTSLVTRSAGPDGRLVTLPPNSEVSPPEVAVEDNAVPNATLPGGGDAETETVGVVRALREAIDVAGPIGSRWWHRDRPPNLRRSVPR